MGAPVLIPSVIRLNLTALNLCTSDVPADCAVTSNANKGTMIPPIQTARINTNGTRSIKYGRVEIKVRHFTLVCPVALVTIVPTAAGTYRKLAMAKESVPSASSRSMVTD